MQNNDNPYIYEKPLKLGAKRSANRLAGFSAIGLLGLVSWFGGTTIANAQAGNNLSKPKLEND